MGPVTFRFEDLVKIKKKGVPRALLDGTEICFPTSQPGYKPSPWPLSIWMIRCMRNLPCAPGQTADPAGRKPAQRTGPDQGHELFPL